MSKTLITSVLGLALAAFAPLTAQAAVHGVFGDGYSEASTFKAQQSGKQRAHKRSGKHYGAHKSGRRSASRSGSRSRGGSRHAHSHGGAGTSRTCLQASARALLSRIESQFGAVQIVSTCRPGAVIAGSGKPSKHRYGLAIDFNAPSGKKGAIVQWLIKNHHSGGTMTYAGMNHIHVDVGQRFVSLGAGGRRRG
ncbi:MAG: D-Ala-D-Ala carboxypeptidase family metallohydrolase [Hyphomicrobiaceae bacterium]|nr:D-Ala-D-Ala carboxypeptidase family metallohydrolase [Hyphomicrobiaceae bacterium]